MLKKIVAITLCLAALLSTSACGTTSDKGNSSETVTGTTFTVGNYVMTIPDGFSAEKSNDSYFLTSKQSGCSIFIFATDVSILDEGHVQQYIASQMKVFVNENSTRYSEKLQEINFGGKTVYMEMYAEESNNGYATINTNGSFTDSWYGYTVAIQCESGSDSLSDDFYSFAEFCATAKYIGKEPRFDFVQ